MKENIYMEIMAMFSGTGLYAYEFLRNIYDILGVDRVILFIILLGIIILSLYLGLKKLRDARRNVSDELDELKNVSDESRRKLKIVCASTMICIVVGVITIFKGYDLFPFFTFLIIGFIWFSFHFRNSDVISQFGVGNNSRRFGMISGAMLMIGSTGIIADDLLPNIIPSMIIYLSFLFVILGLFGWFAYIQTYTTLYERLLLSKFRKS